TIIFKPSSDTPLCAMRLVEILNDAGIPKGVVNMVTGSGSALGKEIVSSRDVGCVSFTGSRETGLWILQNAGIKRVGLELGGKNAIIVMDDADMGLAVDGIIWGAFGTTGQRCTAASRVIVHRKVRRKLVAVLVVRAKNLRVGSGLDTKSDMGPLVNKSALEKVQRYIDIGKKEGASLMCGGRPVSGKGYFYQPTIFMADIDMKIAQDEIFGPVLSVMEAESLDDAIEKANSVDYGLSSSIYTKSITNAMKAAELLEAGITYVNSSTTGSEVHLPFGGVKDTGNGTREGGILGIDEFSEFKTVYIDYSGRLQKAQFD
ncbi:MAG: aldehyde dehydrogenase family protein, partial [Candidatus Aenigmarchaeota archaeon]|nr:aldehyde dehydrogenase family protein [Candidatus Aenigmarchaeota archaeon]